VDSTAEEFPKRTETTRSNQNMEGGQAGKLPWHFGSEDTACLGKKI